MTQTKVSVVIPTMNEEASVGLVIKEIFDAFGQERPVEIIVVDTNSTDRTRDIAAAAGAVVVEEPRRGYGRAYKTGFERASGGIIATLDADLTYPAADIPKLADVLVSRDIDFITTNRFAEMEEGAMRAKHRIGNWLLSATTRLLFRVRVKDSQSGMWVFRSSILPKLELTSDGMAMSEEIKIEAFRKLTAIEVPITYRIRVGDVKLNSWKDGIGNLKFLFKKRF